MKSGELKDIVTEVIQKRGESSVSEVLEDVEEITQNEYAYTTIATILQRLEQEKIVTSEKKAEGGRKKKYYTLCHNAPKDEARNFLQSFVSKFGSVGVRHLGEVMGTEFSEEEIEALREKLEQ